MVKYDCVEMEVVEKKIEVEMNMKKQQKIGLLSTDEHLRVETPHRSPPNPLAPTEKDSASISRENLNESPNNQTTLLRNIQRPTKSKS